MCQTKDILWQAISTVRSTPQTSHTSREQLALARQLVNELESRLPPPSIDSSISLSPDSPLPLVHNKQLDLIHTVEGQLCDLSQRIKCLESGTTLAHAISALDYAANLAQQASQRLDNVKRDLDSIMRLKLKLAYLQYLLHYVRTVRFSLSLAHKFAADEMMKAFPGITLQVLELIIS